MPGTLPVMNRRAVELAVKAASALDCRIRRFTKWDRKNYYYPDLPKNYQISQFDLPLGHDGRLAIHDPKGRFEPKQIRILRAHLEEDAGKSMHDEVAGKADSRIDLNRTGVPLLEIVSQPDLRSPAEAKAYLTELKLLLNYLEVSDCNMQEGSLRVDANVNLHIPSPGETVATPIVEIKNMNSFRSVERALAYEARRQYEVWQRTGKRIGDVPKETRGWDESRGATWGQRCKEESSDYRFFPDPDLVPVTLDDAQIERICATMGERPAQLRTRLEQIYGITPYDSDVIVNQGRALVDYYVALAGRCGDGKLAANWVQQDVLRTLNERQVSVAEFSVSVDALGDLIGKCAAGRIETSRGREVLAEMIATGKSADDVMQAMGIRQVDDSTLEAMARAILATNPKVVAELKEGNLKGAGWLIGQAKRKDPNVNPNRFREICLQMVRQM
jgi:aspartyl-tRNA(Asn)/glutamyl-tRNA(Gln) amidotransferase subunit B